MLKTEVSNDPPNNTIIATAGDYDDNIRAIGDQIANLSLKDAKELSDYLKEVHGIDPAKGGSMQYVPDTPLVPQEEKAEFDVVLESFDKAKKISLIKTMRTMTEMGLKEAKEFVEGVPKVVKAGVSKDDAESAKAALEEAGGQVSIK